jgi:tRNA A-37 threonylcarbamoyl transferase component Bud32/TolA-binding protein
MEGPPARRASDALFAATARRAGRATEEDLADCVAEQARAAAEGKTLTLGQILIRRHKLSADEFIEVARKLDAPIFVCPSCGARHSPRTLDEEPRCLSCGVPLDPRALAAALPEEVVRLGAAPSSAASARTLLLGAESQARGRTFGKYEILKVVGQGGMGVVYKARQLDLDRVVALKILREGEGAREDQVRRFLAEAQAAAKLQHPNIVTIHEVGIEEGVHYFTMDFVEGETLHDKFQRGERFSPDEAARLVATLARAVHYAHQRGIVHRDMKPGNVILPPDGPAKITDFGLAKQAGADLFITKSGVAIGTPLYMSPEQARGDLRSIDGRSDIFSLGTIFYQLLTGELPFLGQSHIEIYNKIMLDDPAPPRQLAPAVPKDLETICLKALEKRPKDRFASGKALADDLERALRGESIEARPHGAGERLLRAVKRHRTLATVAATVALVGAGAYFATATILERRHADADAVARARLAAEARGLLGEARAALGGGRAKDALERAALLLARYPDSDEAREARFIQGEAELASGRVKEALAAFARAYRRARDDESRARALAALAQAFAAGRDLEGAANALRKIVESFPELVEARRAELHLGEILAEIGDRERARRLLETARDAPALAPAERDEAREELAWLDALGAPVDLPGADAAAIGDTDGDGKPELLLLRAGTLVAYTAGPRGIREVYRAEVASPREEVMDFCAADVDGDARAEAILAVVDEELGPCLKVVSLGRGRRGARDDLNSDPEAAEDPARSPAVVTVLARARLPGRVPRNGLAAGDLDGCGRAEIVVCAAGGAGPRLFRLGPGGALVAGDVAPDLAGRASALAAWVGGADRDGRADLLLGTAGPLGDDVRLYRWNPAAAGLELAFRQKVGVVTAVLEEDLDRDGAPDIVLAKTHGAGGARAEYGLGDGLHVLAGRGGAAFAAGFGDALPLDSAAPRRIASLATGDLTASGAASVAAIVEDAAARRVTVYGGFGREGGPWRREIALGERRAEWVRMADLDADGDAELVVGGREFVRIYGLRGHP